MFGVGRKVLLPGMFWSGWDCLIFMENCSLAEMVMLSGLINVFQIGQFKSHKSLVPSPVPLRWEESFFDNEMSQIVEAIWSHWWWDI